MTTASLLKTFIILSCGASVLAADVSELSRLIPGRVRTENGLWIETPPERRFNDHKTVVVADIKGPGVITMIHFALPQLSVADPKYKMNRDTLIQMYWDDEKEPSVNVPFVDFFCDPMGQREVIHSTLVNKKRGWNAYFPMPFRKSARVVLAYEGPESPGEKLWSMMPCYSYVIWRTLDTLADDEGCFHAQWRQDAVLTGKTDYLAMEAKGHGKFIGWNVTTRIPGAPGCPVDMNEKFYIDGESEPSNEYQGIEDSFGFSWGFPPEGENLFAMTGYWPYLKNGAAAYRWFINEFINFSQSLKVTIGYGPNEHPMFREQFSKPGTEIQFSSVCYWYQNEPHAAFPAMLPVKNRGAAPDDRFWLHPESLPTSDGLKSRGVTLHMLCGRPNKEIILAEPGFDAARKTGFTFDGWAPPVYHCAADNNELIIELTVPKDASGKLRVYIMDPDNFQGGRRQRMTLDTIDLGEQRDFQKGKWIEQPVGPELTNDGKLVLKAKNLQPQGNAVVSIIEFVEK